LQQRCLDSRLRGNDEIMVCALLQRENKKYKIHS